MTRFIGRLFAVIVTAWLGLSIVLYSLQASLIYYPDPVMVATPEATGLPYPDVQLQGGHNDGFLRSGPAYRQSLHEFLEHYFPD
jgi:hypothetical protein